LAQVQALREENSKLRFELSAFDEDFFEEMEDLKFKYADALRRLKQFEH
jgi:predicted DNA-binding protein